jgi:hypothetical protein
VSQDGREYYAVSKTLILKKRGIEIKKEITELRITRMAASGKEFWIRENVLKPIWRVCCKETLDIVNTVLSNGPQWLMSTWILTEKLSKITAQARKINQEIAK